MPERFECTSLAKKALYKYSSFPFLSFHQYRFPFIPMLLVHTAPVRYRKEIILQPPKRTQTESIEKREVDILLAVMRSRDGAWRQCAANGAYTRKNRQR